MADFLTIGSSYRETLQISPAVKKGEPDVAPILINPAFGLTEGVTTGVPATALATWLEANAKHPAVLNGLLRNRVTGEVLGPKAPTIRTRDDAKAS